MNEDDLIVVFEGTIVESDIVKSMLDSDGVTCFMKDDRAGTLAPFYTSVGGVNPIRIVVPRSELDNAAEVIERFKKNK